MFRGKPLMGEDEQSCEYIAQEINTMQNDNDINLYPTILFNQRILQISHIIIVWMIILIAGFVAIKNILSSDQLFINNQFQIVVIIIAELLFIIVLSLAALYLYKKLVTTLDFFFEFPINTDPDLIDKSENRYIAFFSAMGYQFMEQILISDDIEGSIVRFKNMMNFRFHGKLPVLMKLNNRFQSKYMKIIGYSGRSTSSNEVSSSSNMGDV